MTSPVPVSVSRTSARVASACRATLPSASDTTKYAVVSTVSGTGRRRSAYTSTGMVTSSASSRTAPANPRSVRLCGRMPWTICRSNTISPFACSCATARGRAAGESCGTSSRARPIWRLRLVSRGCAPSCRSRSMRRRSASYASTNRARDRVTSRSASPSGAPRSSHRATVPCAVARAPAAYHRTGTSSTPTIACGTASTAVSGVAQSRTTWSPLATRNGLTINTASNSTSMVNSQYTAGTRPPRKNR